jgi:hypothetical protein
MVLQNTTGPPVPANLTPLTGFMEFFLILVQNRSLPPLTAQAPVPPAASLTPFLDDPPLSTGGCSFTRVGCGKGGALVEKEKVSKQIMALATKCKTLVDSDIKPWATMARPLLQCL